MASISIVLFAALAPRAALSPPAAASGREVLQLIRSWPRIFAGNRFAAAGHVIAPADLRRKLTIS